MILEWLLSVIVLVSMAVVIYGAVAYLTAKNDANKKTKAWKIIFYSVIIFILSSMVYSILTYRPYIIVN